MAADGSIVIDTKLNTSGMNTGVKSLGSSLKGILDIVKTIGKTLVAAFIGGSIINSLRGLIGSFDFFKSSLAGTFKPLSSALDTLKGTFINLIATALVPLIPYIVTAVQWFTHLLAIATQVIAALFGMQKTIGGVASETKKVTKETKGALAAFDQINVLQQQQTNQSDQTPFITPEAMDVPQSFLDKIKEIKDIIASWWNDPIGKIKETWGAIVAWFKANVIDPLVQWWNNTWLGQMLGKLWDSFKSAWGKLMINTIQTFEDIKAHILQAFQGVKEFLTGVFTGDWALAWQGLKNIVVGVFGALWDVVRGSLTNWLLLFQWLKVQLIPIISNIWDWLKTKALDAWNSIKSIWTTLVSWFTATVTNPLKTVFNDALNSIASAFQTVFGGIKNYVLGVVNSIIATISIMINTIISGFNNLLSLFSQPEIPPVPSTGGGGSTGGHSGGGAPPRLATGAVIPPNSQFAAILGDQRSGTNIEAPAAMFQEMLNQAVAAGSGNQTITIKFTGTGADIARILKPQLDRENSRVGKSFIVGK